MSGLDYSVVIPAYNASKTIAAAVRSGLDSGASHVIVVDDGSTDDTVTVAQGCGAQVISQANAGAATARRNGVASVRTELAVLLDADDELVPAGISRSLRVLASSPKVGLVAGLTIGRSSSGEKLIRPWPEGQGTVSLLQRGHAPAPPGAYVWRTDILREVLFGGPLGVWPRFAEDYELLIRASLITEIEVHEQPSCLYRWQGGKSSSTPRASISDASKIRNHYASIGGIAIKPWEPHELNRMVLMRRASERLGRTAWLSRSVLVGQALLADPRFGLAAARRRIRSAAGAKAFLDVLMADWTANRRDPKARLLLVLFRVAALGRSSSLRRLLMLPFEIAYRLVSEIAFGVELRPKTAVGPGLTIFHGVGLVVNDDAIIGSGVKLRQGVTIGHSRPGGRSPRLGDNVDVGAGVIILGDVEIGSGATLGAGSVVTRSVRPGATVVGNPAREVGASRTAESSLKAEGGDR